MRTNDLGSRHRPQNHDLTAVNRQARRRYRRRLRAATHRESPRRRFGRWLDRRVIALGAAVRRVLLVPLGGDPLEWPGYGEGLMGEYRVAVRVEPAPTSSALICWPADPAVTRRAVPLLADTIAGPVIVHALDCGDCRDQVAVTFIGRG